MTATLRMLLAVLPVIWTAALMGQTPAAPRLMVWGDRELMTRPNALQTELSINGKVVDLFSGGMQKDIGQHLQKGWNTIVLKTQPRALVLEPNQLLLNFGATRPGAKRNQLEMDPVLWTLRTGTGWELRDGKYVSPLGADVKEVTQTFRVFYAGLAGEPRKLQVKNGDYVLTVESRAPAAVPLLLTASINGTPLNTFVGNKRNVVVTPLLKKGRNELKLAVARLKDCLVDNELVLLLAGPARFNAQKKVHEFAVVKEFSTREDWQRDPKSGRVVHRADPALETAERVLEFVLEETPKTAGQ